MVLRGGAWVDGVQGGRGGPIKGQAWDLGDACSGGVTAEIAAGRCCTAGARGGRWKLTSGPGAQ